MKRIPRIKKDKLDQGPGIKEKLRGRKVKAIISFIIVLLLAFVALPMMYSKQSDTATVAVVKVPISKGQEITQEMFSMEKIGVYGISKSLVIDKEEVLNKRALVDMVKGDLIYEEKIGKSTTDPLIDAFIQKGHRLVTVSFKTNAAGLASHVEKGDIVNVACVESQMDEYGYEKGVAVLNYQELKELEVYDVENMQTKSVDDEKASSDNNADPIVHTITFVASDAQANRLIECEYKGILHIIFIAKDRTQIPEPPKVIEEPEGVDFIE